MQADSLSKVADSIALAREILPEYRLIGRLGRGGFAEVWEAEAPGGFRVALKLVRLSAKSRPRELRAIDNIRDIRHPNLLTTFGAWHVEELLIIGMELAERSLWDRFLEVRTQGLRGIPRRELLGYLSATAHAIDYLNRPQHSVGGRANVGIQHRDLKPQNILLFGSSAKVADFGLSRIMEEGIASHTGTWTLAYAAPEFFHGLIAHHSDQYSLAVTYCQLRGGRLPFRGATAEIAAGHMFFPPDLEALPLPERPVVTRALAKRPDDRWPDCRAFCDALQSLAPEDPDAIPDFMGQDDEGTDLNTPVDSRDRDDRTPLRSDSYRRTTEARSPWSFSLDSTEGGSSPRSIEGLVAPVVPARGPFTTRSGNLAATLLLASGLALFTVVARLPDDRSRPEFSRVAMAEPSSSPDTSSDDRGEDPNEDSHSKAMTGLTSPPAQQDASQAEGTPPGLEVAAAGRIPAPDGPEVHSTVVENREGLDAPPTPDVPNASLPLEERARLDLPDRLSLHQGEQRRLPVRIERGAVSGPLSLEFDGLPQGLSLRCPSFAAEDDTAEAVVSASANAPAAESEITVRLAERPGQAAAQLKIRILPDPSRIATESGLAHLRQGSCSQAVTAFDEAIRLDPKHANAYICRGQAYHVMRRYPEALADYSEALRLRPADADTLILRARVHQETGSPAPALADYSEAIRLRPNDASLYLARGRILHDLGLYDRALADFTEVIRLRPEDPTAHYRRGLVRYHSGDNPGAIADFSVVIRLKPDHANAYRYRSEAYARSGNGARASADHDDFDQLALGQSHHDGDHPPSRSSIPSPAKSKRVNLPFKFRPPQDAPTALH